MAENKILRIEVTEEKILCLLKAGHVCAMDFRCLDCKSKQCLLRLCLESCASAMTTGKKMKQ